MKKIVLFLSLVILLIIPGILGLFHSGFFVTDDGSWMIVRFTAFFDALKHGQFPVRFLSRLNFEYGYPVADFLYPLFLYIGVPIKIIGFSFVNTIKIIFGISLLLSGVFSFFWLKNKFSYVAASVGAITYSLFPYHLWDIYKRGSIGEVLALCIVPFVLWQIERKSIFLAAIGMGLLVTSHNVMALFFLPVSIIYAYLTKKFSVKEIMLITALGLGSSAFFWFPALFDKQYTLFDTIAVSNISQYFLSFSDYILFGFITVFALLHSLFYIKKGNIVFIFFLMLGVVSVLITFPFAKPLWGILPGTNFIQFPFRILSLTTLSIAFLVAYNLEKLKKSNMLFIAGVYLLVIYLSGWNLLIPRYFENYPDSYYATNVDSTTVKNEYLPKWVKEAPKTIPQQKVLVISGKATISNLQENADKITFSVNSQSEAKIQINTVYFPGWQVFINGKASAFSYDNQMGVIMFPVAANNSIVVVQFSETIARLIADGISVLSILIIFCVPFIIRKIKK